MLPPLTQTMYLRFNTKADAQTANADYWTRILGHPKNPQDTTQFTFQALGCLNGGWDYLVLTEPLFSQLWPFLSATEQNFVNVNMVDVNNTQVQSCLTSLGTPV